MNVSLTPEMKRLVDSRVKAGEYSSARDVVQAGLLLLQERDEHLAALRAEIREGFDAIRRGEYDDYNESTTPKLAAEIKARGRAHLSASRLKAALK